MLLDNGKLVREMFENKIKDVHVGIDEYITQYQSTMLRHNGGRRGSIQGLMMDSTETWLLISTTRNYLAIWNVSMKVFTKSIILPGTPSVGIFYGTTIFTAGCDNIIYKWNINAELQGKIESSLNVISDMKVNQNGESKYHVLFSCGKSNRIDIFPNLTRKSFSFTFPDIK